MTADRYKQIEDLYLEMYEKLMQVARKNEESEALAEEAVQETFIVALQKPEECLECPNPQGWLISSLFYVIKNAKKKRSNAKRIAEQYLMEQFKEAAVSQDRLDLDILYGKTAQMDEFKLISEMAIEGRSHEEMAKSRGISVNACKKRVQRAKERLQTILIKDVTK